MTIEERKMTAGQWFARAQAWEECADHLNLAWTADAEERAQGKIVAGLCRVEIERCERNAAKAQS